MAFKESNHEQTLVLQIYEKIIWQLRFELKFVSNL